MSSDLEKRLAALSPEKRALLEKRLNKPRPAREPSKAPERRAGDRVPLSFAQERLWFIEQLQSVGSVYNLPAYLRIQRPLDLAALQNSLDEVVRRHEILRTRFVMVEGRPMQETLSSAHVDLTVVDLQDRPPEVREAEAQQIAYRHSLHPFDLEAGPIFRASLLRLAENDAVLLLCMHHIAGDGWSLGVLYDELAQLYDAFAAGRPSPLPELPVQYADYARWQREQLQGEVLAQQLAYWQAQLAGAPPLLPLPCDRPRPPVQSFRGAVQQFAIPPQVAAAIKALAQQEGTTLFMALLAVFSILMHRYTDQDDIVIGSPIANRSRVEFERLIGFFTNTLALRIRLDGNPSMRELLQRVKAVALGAYAHQDVPFEKLVELLRPERSLGHNPLFQVMFVLQYQEAGGTTWNERSPADAPASGPGGARGAGASSQTGALQATPAAAGTAKFDLTLVMSETSAGLLGSLEFNTDIFDPPTAARMAAHFIHLLEGLSASPDRSVATVPFLLAEERQLLEVWSRTPSVAITGAGYMHATIEDQAARHPDAIAATFLGQGVSYGELNRRANRLAHHLVSLGVGPEMLVGICIHRSLELLVAILAVLKSGGAYVPLDPKYPKHRLAFMLADARVPILLTQSDLLAQLPEHDARTVCVDAGAERYRDQPDHDFPCRATPQNLAYVIYTSGSTGKPKGVAITHEGLAHIAQAATATFGTGPGTRMLQFSSLSFDASILELVSTLPVGGTLCLAPADHLIPGPDLVKQIRDDHVNTAIVPPSALAEMTPEDLRSVTTLIVAGEAFAAEFASKWLPGRRLFNAYGPTEITICATAFGFQGPWRVPPIGRPLPGKEVHILDRHLQRVPIGVLGELYMGGMGLARGYLGRPGLTADRFIPDPFRDQAGARLYRTGDVVRYLLDGNIEFLGRVDNQVKLRGYRIELDEVQAVLAEHPAVRECAVIVRGEHDQRLVAYLVPNDPGTELDIVQLRRYLQERMPDYMVPAMFVTLEALPLTLNGKIDRAALPEPRAQHAGSAQDQVAPRNALERALTEIWAQVLKLDRVGIHDNFFDLGGHSLLMTQVASRVRDRLRLDLPLRRFMETPTIAELAAVLQHEPPAPALPTHKTTIPRLERRIRNIPAGGTAERTGPDSQE